ncbi:MAG TPA: asparagine synthase (glutamine-hydrolyzing) [Xanthobacteraceae bacterium]|nr:asparagine synthase (glutamine-hydrolyzing) [Xanthobacteraceae bacterium]
MCGIAGILSQQPEGLAPPRLEALTDMTDALQHRGPDGAGLWTDRHAGIALGHRRLAIVDLTESGRQPMLSGSGRYVVTFNGEIYNFQALRSELANCGHGFRGTSDTEVLLAAVEAWGLERALCRSRGMFALVLWDRKTRTLHFARDRMGKKPLYLLRAPTELLFASELKAFHRLAGSSLTIDPEAVTALLARGWVPDDRCIWSNVFKLPPAGILAVRAEALRQLPDVASLRAASRRWWSLEAVARAGRSDPIIASDEELVDELDALLRHAVGERMVADVPIGAFLSGGIDSSTVVAEMQAQSSRPVRTFTIGFSPSSYDESENAAAVARHLGTDHTELRLTAEAARNVIPELPHVWDEPFADESQIPTLLVARLARRDVTVAMTGDGGDECFAGYSRHVLAARLSPLLGATLAVRRPLAAALLRLAQASRSEPALRLPLPAGLERTLRSDRIDRLARLLLAPDENAFYAAATLASELCLDGRRMDSDRGQGDLGDLGDLASRIVLRDMEEYLPGDILVKLDRASMANSLEGRCPLLDHRVVELSWRVPMSAKIRHGKGKWLLRQVLARHVPRRLFERPKQGFDVPIAAWLRGPLREWASDLLGAERLRRQGLLDPVAVQACWNDHLVGRSDRSRVLWAALMLQAWIDAVAIPPRADALADHRDALQGA